MLNGMSCKLMECRIGYLLERVKRFQLMKRFSLVMVMVTGRKDKYRLKEYDWNDIFINYMERRESTFLIE
jgi:hypothetical protein